MKKIFRNSRLIAVAFLTVFSVSAVAADSTGLNPALPAELKFAGMFRENAVFELNIDGGETDDYVISIADRKGERLYAERIRAGKFTKRFLLNAEELGEEKLYFTVYSKKSNQSAVYEISSQSRLVRETTVNLVSQ